MDIRTPQGFVPEVRLLLLWHIPLTYRLCWLCFRRWYAFAGFDHVHCDTMAIGFQHFCFFLLLVIERELAKRHAFSQPSADYGTTQRYDRVFGEPSYRTHDAKRSAYKMLARKTQMFSNLRREHSTPVQEHVHSTRHPAQSLPPRSQRGSSAPRRLFRAPRRVTHNPTVIPPSLNHPFR